MISPPPLGSIICRVKELITAVSKKKKSHITKATTEIENLLKFCDKDTFEKGLLSTDREIYKQYLGMSGNTATSGSRVPIISALLDDLDFGDPRSITNKEDQKVMNHNDLNDLAKIF